VLKERLPRLASTEPNRDPPMVRDSRVAAIVVLVVIVALLAVACSVSRQARGPTGSVTPDPALATRVAAAQALVDATRAANASAAAVTDATAAARNTATAVAQSALLTETPPPAAIVTSQPSVASTVVPKPATASQMASTSTPGTGVYKANFANWDSGEKGMPYPARLSYDATTHQYLIALTDAKRAYAYQVYSPDPQKFADFELDVDAGHIAGPGNGSYGVLFRIQPRSSDDKANADIALLVHPDEQYFALNLLRADGTGTNIGKGNTVAISKGDATNHLTVICQGDSVAVAINSHPVGSYSTTLLTAGAVGLVVSSPPNPSGSVGMQAAFTNLRVSPVAGH
jgi:hypothetical protein